MGIKRTLLNIGWLLMPQALKTKVKEKHDNRVMQQRLEKFKTKVSQQEVYDLFAQLDIHSDLMVHSSLWDIGNIDKQSKYVVECLDSIVAEGHTILFPALPQKGSSAQYLKSIDAFDARTAPNAMGKLSMVYQRREGSKRSMSPTHSVVAYGPKADYYVGEHHLDSTPFTIRSPYYKLLACRGKILFFGATVHSLTFAHVLEDMMGDDFPIRVYTSQASKVKIILPNGKTFENQYYGHSRWSGLLRDMDDIIPHLMGLDSTRSFALGAGKVVMLDARDTMMCLLELLEHGQTTMGRCIISRKTKEKIEYWKNIIAQL